MSKPSDFSPKGGAAELPGAPSTRQLRIGEEIRRTLAEIFTRTEFRDPDLHDVQITVTEVRVAPDLKHATVFVSRLGLGQSGVAPLLPALKRVAPWLRSQLAHKLRLRGVPELHFQSDESLDHAMEVDSLLRSPEVSRDLGHGQQFGQQNEEELED